MNTADLPRDLRGESRRHVRIQENTHLLWHIRENGLVGQARIRNISTSGMLLELTSVNALADQSVLSFDSNLNDANYIPETGRLVWRKKKRFWGNRYLCGIQFVDPPIVLLYRLRKRVEASVKNLIRMWKINQAVSIFLAGVMVILVAYAVWLGGIIFQDISSSSRELLATANQQVDLTREYQRLYADSTRRLADVTLELNLTTALYQESQKSLQATEQELAVAKSALSQTESLLAESQAKNVEAEQQVVAARSQAGQASAAQDIVSDIPGGKALIALYRDQIKQVGAQINQIKYEDHMTQVSAVEERDRVRLMYGNHGYFVKSGQPVEVDERQYQAASFDELPPGKVPNPDSKVRVNVTVFQ